MNELKINYKNLYYTLKIKKKMNRGDAIRCQYYLPGDKYFSQYFLVVSLLLNLDMGRNKFKILYYQSDN